MNLINNLQGGHCFGSSRTRRITGGKKSPRLNWAIQFLTVAYDGVFPLMFLSEWREFPSAPCLAGEGGNLITARVSMLLKSLASPDMFPFSLCKKKRLAVEYTKTCNSAHEQTPLSNDTIDSVLRHREVGRAKDLSAPPRKCYLIQLLRLS